MDYGRYRYTYEYSVYTDEEVTRVWSGGIGGHFGEWGGVAVD